MAVALSTVAALRRPFAWRGGSAGRPPPPPSDSFASNTTAKHHHQASADLHPFFVESQDSPTRPGRNNFSMAATATMLVTDRLGPSDTRCLTSSRPLVCSLVALADIFLNHGCDRIRREGAPLQFRMPLCIRKYMDERLSFFHSLKSEGLVGFNRQFPKIILDNDWRRRARRSARRLRSSRRWNTGVPRHVVLVTGLVLNLKVNGRGLWRK